MGQAQSAPEDLSRELQVIGCGMSRTGTVSFSMALSKLLDGPVHHGGSAIFEREEAHIKQWISILKFPLQNQKKHEKQIIRKTLSNLLAGHVAVVDGPGSFFIEELMELYPNAKVICTTRDEDAWWTSMEGVMKNAHMDFLKFVFVWVATCRYFGAYADSCEVGRVKELHCAGGEKTYVKESYGYHMDHIRKVVPPEKLLLYSVKEGWEPLCKALDLPVPNEPFPRANDGQAMQEFFEGKVKLGLRRWLEVFLVVIVFSVAVRYYLKM